MHLPNVTHIKYHFDENDFRAAKYVNGQAALFATDQLGSIFSIADSSGKSVQEVLYNYFGRQILNSAPEEELWTNTIRITGKNK